MNKPTVLSIFLLPLVCLLTVWSLFYASTRTVVERAQGPHAAADTPEKILAHVRALQSPLVLINFWASWCEPCKEELPALKNLQEKFSKKGLKVVLVSIDDIDEMAEAENYLTDNNIGFKSFYKGSQSLKFVTQIFPDWNGAVPATLLMGPGLKILDSWEGDKSLEEFEELVLPHLGGKT